MVNFVKTIVQKVTSRGLRYSLKLLASEIYIFILHNISNIKARRYRHLTGLKLNLGCGKNSKPGWINIDIDKGSDLRLDLREKFPFRDNSCDYVYTEHFLEHLEYPENAIQFVQEIHRVLLPGGILSVGVPDTEWPINCYASDVDNDYFRFISQKWHPSWCRTRMEHINFHFRQGDEHHFAYDLETLSLLLEKAGFGDIIHREFDHELDTPERKQGTLYVEARKRDLTF